MSDDLDVGTERLQETIEERRREAVAAERAEQQRPRWLDYLAISTALFAVFAAVAALEAGAYANEALFRANQAVLRQTQAVDAWSEYQADSIKKYEQQSVATLLTHVGGSATEIQAAKAEAARRQAREDELQREATARDAETNALSRESEHQLEYHHRFALTVTLFQVGIGLSAIAALLRMRVVWFISLAAGAVALLVFIDSFTLTI